MWGNGDLESRREQEPLLYSGMDVDALQRRWPFICKIYTIVGIQLLLSITVAYVVVNVHLISHFLTATNAGLTIYIVLVITPIIVTWPLVSYYHEHPLNFILFGIFTSALAFSVGLTCAYTNGKVIIEALILTAAVVVSLTLYTFWAAKRGHDSHNLPTFLFAAIIFLLVFGTGQVCNTALSVLFNSWFR